MSLILPTFLRMCEQVVELLLKRSLSLFYQAKLSRTGNERMETRRGGYSQSSLNKRDSCKGQTKAPPASALMTFSNLPAA